MKKYLKSEEKTPKTLEEIFNDIPSYPNLPGYFLEYVKKQLVNINADIKKYNNFKEMYENIVTSTFTNKYKEGYDFKKYPEDVKKNVELFNRYSKKYITEYKNLIGIKKYKIFSKSYVKIFRMIRVKNPERDLIHPIPFSCSWSINFPIYEWGGMSECCVMEIIMPMDHLFLSTSVPDKKYLEYKKSAKDAIGKLPKSKNFWEEIKRTRKKFDEKYWGENIKNLPLNIINQDQLELVLSPCLLKYLYTRKETFSSKENEKSKNVDVNIYTYKVTVDSKI
jgi:hypothetical protein